MQSTLKEKNLDNGVRDFFIDSEYEVSYGDLMLSPALFQDDVSRLCDDPVSVQMGNNKMEAMAEIKLLDFNMDKSCLMVIGKKKKVREDMENKLAENPPLLYGKKMKQVKVEKYLGEQISSGGLAESVTATVNKRTGRVLQSIFEIRTMIDDCRSHVTGGIMTGLEIWEVSVIPFLMNNSDTWINISATTLDKLDSLQNLFYRVLLSVPVGGCFIVRPAQC